MSTTEGLIDAIEQRIERIANIPPFKFVAFGDLDVNMRFPAMHFLLKSRSAFDPPHLRHDTMQLRWELTYDVQVLFTRLTNSKAYSESRRHVDKAVEIFINQMAESERLGGLAWWIEPDEVRYGVIELESASKKEYILGGVFRLNIKFIQNVS